jgi:hypothetical protein
MYDPINPPNSHLKTPRLLKIVNLDEFEAVLMLRAGLQHCGAFGGGACCTPHSQAASEEGVDDVCADEAGCAGDENGVDFHLWYFSSGLEF